MHQAPHGRTRCGSKPAYVVCQRQHCLPSLPLVSAAPQIVMRVEMSGAPPEDGSDSFQDSSCPMQLQTLLKLSARSLHVAAVC